MRVACSLHLNSVEKAIESYKWMSKQYFTHATPTLINAGLRKSQQMASCFLLSLAEDSIDNLYRAIHKMALISQRGGGIGISLSMMRASGGVVGSLENAAGGLLKALRVLNDVARHVDQGGRRKGSFAVYIEPWHADVFDFLDAKKNHGLESHRARDLFYALWVPDLFMERVESDGDWSLYCPYDAASALRLREVSEGRLLEADTFGRNDEDTDEEHAASPSLLRTESIMSTTGIAKNFALECSHGDDFNEKYTYLETKCPHIARKTMKARHIWNQIVKAQMETGGPFILYKDQVNRTSMQKNLGVIKCSNLCCEIVEFSGENEIAVCNLASIALPKFVEPPTACNSRGEVEDECNVTLANGGSPDGRTPSQGSRAEPVFNFAKLREVVHIVTRNLNRAIDVSKYPVPDSKNSNLKHRPIGIGVQGLTDLYHKMGFAFGSEDARVLNREVFETIYFAACEASIDLAQSDGPYETYKLTRHTDNNSPPINAPAAENRLHFDFFPSAQFSGRWDWANLKARLAQHGIRNSLLTAVMPTASTAQILGNCESIEARSSNLFVRRVLSGEFVCVCKPLVEELIARNLWTENIREELIGSQGSVQKLSISDKLPESVKERFKTAWELRQKAVLDQAVDRAPFVDQAQSMNVYLNQPTLNKVSSMLFYGWRNGLKTGCYYLRSRSAVEATPVTVDLSVLKNIKSARSARPSVVTDSSVLPKELQNQEEMLDRALDLNRQRGGSQSFATATQSVRMRMETSSANGQAASYDPGALTGIRTLRDGAPGAACEDDICIACSA